MSIFSAKKLVHIEQWIRSICFYHMGRSKHKSVFEHAKCARIQIHLTHAQSLIRMFAFRENTLYLWRRKLFIPLPLSSDL